MHTVLDLDARLSEKMRVAERPGLLRTCAALLAHSGDSWFWLLALGLLWLLGPQDWRPTEVILAASIVVTAVVVMAMTPSRSVSPVSMA